MLTCENLSLSYGEKAIFSNFSVSIYFGSIIFVRGANGSGKTSLLRVLSSLVRPNSGKILCNDHDIDKNISSYRNVVNYITSKTSTNFSLSVIENIEFWANIYKTTELISASIHYFGLSEYIDTNVEYLSDGTKQKLELTRLITKPSQIWLLDEPENNLDDKARELLNNLIVTKANQGGIVIIASHNNYYMKDAIQINICDYYMK